MSSQSWSYLLSFFFFVVNREMAQSFPFWLDDDPDCMADKPPFEKCVDDEKYQYSWHVGDLVLQYDCYQPETITQAQNTCSYDTLYIFIQYLPEDFFKFTLWIEYSVQQWVYYGSTFLKRMLPQPRWFLKSACLEKIHGNYFSFFFKFSVCFLLVG